MELWKSMIKNNEISVVVQGAIDKIETPKCLHSIRKYLPDAEIILSTWEGSDASGLDYDVLILNKDPGAVIFTTDGVEVYNNLNRQLFSTQEGLKLAGRKYALKMRSDLILSHNKFLNYFDKYQARSDKYKLFRRKIIIPTMYTRKFVIKDETKEKCFTPFHPSDFFFFGLNEDIKALFLETKLVKEPQYSNYFKTNLQNADKRYHTVSCYQYPPEQYFMLSCIQRKIKDVSMADLTDITPENVLQSEIIMVNNFIVLEHKQHGYYLHKYSASKNEKSAGFYDAYGLYFNALYEKDYKQHCDSIFKLKTKNVIQDSLDIEPYKYKFYEHFYRIFNNKTPLHKKPGEIFSIIAYSIKIINAAFTNLFKKIWAKTH